MSVRNDLKILLEANIITKDTADEILAFYQEQEAPTSSNRLFVAFAIFGALLVSLGLILIVAHNWDQFSLSVKTVFAFCPLLASQVLAGYCLLRKSDAMAWKEGTAISLIFCLGACMAMISQIYQIAGSLEAFMLTWVLLSIPAIYIMRSSMASLLCIAGITIYGCQVNYWSGTESSYFICWLLLIAVVPYYLHIWRSGRSGN
ncbi:MAG: DUF2157 domain-containing protein [Saprospiraceae bacterium]|nr:DUF2157 domain-containing protein [Saprospiraceae bacterium]